MQRENEEQPFQTDPKVKHIVYVMHGIRDQGRWAAEFETRLLKRFREQQEATVQSAQLTKAHYALLSPTGAGPLSAAFALFVPSPYSEDKLVIDSPRYGYLAMAPFLIRSVRQKYVRWFMDEYTETLARYPNAERIDLVAHSNGTYLVASALEQYQELKVNRIVFAGSVVPSNYDWSKRLPKSEDDRDYQVEAVRNYMASDDVVVGVFPHFFEQWLICKLGNDLGGAGFNGFSQAAPGTTLENVGWIRGGHSAFQEQKATVVDFLLPGPNGPTVAVPNSGRQGVYDLMSCGCTFVWLIILNNLILIGSGVTCIAKKSINSRLVLTATANPVIPPAPACQWPWWLSLYLSLFTVMVVISAGWLAMVILVLVALLHYSWFPFGLRPTPVRLAGHFAATLVVAASPLGLVWALIPGFVFLFDYGTARKAMTGVPVIVGLVVAVGVAMAYYLGILGWFLTSF